MAERLSEQAAQEAQKAVTRPILIAHFDFPNEPVRAWSGIGTLTWDGHDWIGVGTLGEVAAIEETLEVRATGGEFRLSGVPSDLLLEVSQTPLQNRPVKLWLSFMQEDWLGLAADPVLIFQGRMDTLEITDGGSTATIVLRAENRLRDLERERIRRYTTEDQASEYAGDLGFAYVPELQEFEIHWGSPV